MVSSHPTDYTAKPGLWLSRRQARQFAIWHALHSLYHPEWFHPVREAGYLADYEHFHSETAHRVRAKRRVRAIKEARAAKLRRIAAIQPQARTAKALNDILDFMSRAARPVTASEIARGLDGVREYTRREKHNQIVRIAAHLERLIAGGAVVAREKEAPQRRRGGGRVYEVRGRE